LRSAIRISRANSATVSTSAFVTLEAAAFRGERLLLPHQRLRFLAPTGAVEDGLTVAEYDQGTTRYAGTEAKFETALHSAFWLNTALDYVNAELSDDNTPLPRIPPLRGRVGLEIRYKGCS
jgi:hypothetical protein